MPTLTHPGFFLAGALLAAIPVLLHFLARRPPDRAPLPTARFLRPDARTKLGLRSRPDHLLLLLLRVLFLLLLGLAFARPVWAPERSGTLRIVLLDQGAAMTEVWNDAVAEAVSAVRDGGVRESVLVSPDGRGGRPGEARAPAVLSSESLSGTRIDSIRRAGPAEGAPGRAADAATTGRFRYLGALRAARRVAEESAGFDSVEVRLVTRPRHEAWSAGMQLLRPALWPGRVELVEVRGDATARRLPEAVEPAPPVRVHAAPGEGRFVAAGLRALGREVLGREALSGGGGAGAEGGARDPASGEEADVDPEERARTHVVAGERSAEALDRVIAEALDRVRARGDTLILLGLPLADMRDEHGEAIPWRVSTTSPASAGDAGARPAEGRKILLDRDGAPVAGVLSLPGAPAPGARVPLLRADGRAAAAGMLEGDGCVVYLAVRPEAEALPLSPRFPEILAALLEGCRNPEPFPGEAPIHGERPGFDGAGPAAGADAAGGAVTPLDEDALDLLLGGDLPVRVSSASLREAGGATGGQALSGWLLAVALLVALLEAFFAYGPEWRRRRG